MRKDDLDLNQLLADPLIRLVMRSDGVDESDIRRLARQATVHRLAAPAPAVRRCRPACPPA